MSSAAPAVKTRSDSANPASDKTLSAQAWGMTFSSLIPRKSQSHSPYFSAAFTVSSRVSLAYRWQQVRQVEVGGIAARRA
jgi:hypothetical protein